MVYNLDYPFRVKMFGNVFQKSGNWHNGKKSSANILIYCTEGEMNIKINEKVFNLKRGDLLFIPENSLYIPLEGGCCRYYFFHFSAPEAEENEEICPNIVISPHTGLTEGYAYSCDTDYTSVCHISQYIENIPFDARNIFERAAKLRPNSSYSDQLLLDHFLKELLIYLSSISPGKTYKRLMEILEYIEQNYYKSLSLSVLAENFSLSKSYIDRLFKKELSCKPSEYVNKVRISVAKTMLLQTDLSVTAIAEKVGYSDIYYFSKIFKQIVGCSPLKARQ